MLKYVLVAAVASMILGVVGCSKTPTAVDVTASLQDSMKQADLKDVTVKQDLDKGVVTIGGHVPSEIDKSRAETIAKATAPGQVVANEIAVLPVGAESTAKDINSDLDSAIDKNLDAALLKDGMHEGVKYDVKIGVVTLTGEVSSQAKRAATESLAAAVPNVKQVVNKLEVKGQKATSTSTP
ncbi:MAG: BON domain-containing protein [Acidobacteriota bacterium]